MQGEADQQSKRRKGCEKSKDQRERERDQRAKNEEEKQKKGDEQEGSEERSALEGKTVIDRQGEVREKSTVNDGDERKRTERKYSRLSVDNYQVQKKTEQH